MTTYGTMLDRIEDEILRTDLTSNVQKAVLSAIEHYESQRFWFTEGNNVGEVTTGSSNTATYTLSSEWVGIDVLTVTVSNSEYPLIKRTVDWFKEVNVTPANTAGIPTDYVLFNDQIWLYPSPNSAYSLTIYGHRKITALDSNGIATLTDTTVSNGWFTHGERLIRNRAKYYLFADVLESQERAAFYGGEDPVSGITRGEEGNALRALMKRTAKKLATGTIEPEYI